MNKWESRQLKRLDKAEELLNYRLRQLYKTYQVSNKNVTQDLNILLNQFKGTITSTELNSVMSFDKRLQLLNSVNKLLLDQEKVIKQFVKTNTFKQGISFRVDFELEYLTDKQKELRSLYSDVLVKSFNTLTEDIGIAYTLPKSSVNSILNKPWVKDDPRTFIQRIDYNRKSIIKDVNKVLEQSKVEFKSVRDLTKYIQSQNNLNLMEATRVARTETNYFFNEGTRLGYERGGVKKYIYSAVNDNRTSELCLNLDQREFLLSNAVQGENYPSMHVNCRSTTYPAIETPPPLSELESWLESQE